MVVYELFEVAAKSPDEAIEKAKAGAKGQRRTKSMYVAAEYLDQLHHPVHLLEAQEKFVSSVANAEPIAEDYAESAE